MKRRCGLYLHRRQREIFVNQLKDNYKIFDDKISPILSENAEEVTDKFQNQQLEESYVNDYDELCEIEAKSYHFYNLILVRNYRLLATWICCTCELWEQQILQFLHQEIANNHINNKQPEDWNLSKKILKEYEVDIEKMDCWNKISELRDFVNTIKHSVGKSEKRLRKKRPDLFIINGCDKMELYYTSLGDFTLNVKDDDLKNYTDALVEFWENVTVDKWLLKKGKK